MFVNRNLSSLSDAELLSQFKASGQQDVLSQLFVRYSSLLYGLCMKYLKDRDEAKDMVMQVYEKLPAKLKNHEVTYFKSWLYTTTRNECLMHLRSQKGKVHKEFDPSLMENDLVLHLEEEPEMEANLTKLEHCIGQLMDEQKKCVSLFFMQEKCYKEITGLTGFDLNKVKSHIQNGKRNLKICMERMQDWNNDIERYKSGKMTSSEMNALERKALSDPFLADALDGIEEISTDDFVKDIAALNEKILGNEKKSFWIPLRIAAGIFVVIGVSLTFYFLSKEDKSNKLLSANTENKIVDSIPSDDDSIIKKPDLLTLNESSVSESKEKSKEEQSRASKPREQVTTTPPSTILALKQPEVNTETESEPASIVLPEPVLAEKKEEARPMKAEEVASEKLALAEAKKADALRSALRDETEKDSRKKSTSPSSSYAEESIVKSINEGITKNLRVVTGKVTSAEDGSVLPGVNVVIKGTTKGTITDEEGNYRIELGAEKNPELSFTFIGTTTNEVPVNNQSNIDTQLAVDVSQLSEVVVVGYGTDNGVAADDDFPTLIIAEPNGGRRAFKKYLETNIQYPQQALENKIEGKVTVQFTVTTDGALNEFKVIKGIGSGCDEEVIRLIKQGPKWYPSRKGDAAVDSRMRVRMRFKLP